MAQTRALLFIEFQNTSLSCTHKRRNRNLSFTEYYQFLGPLVNAGEYLMDISWRKSSVSATASPQLPCATGTAYFYTFFTWVYWHLTNYRINRLSRKCFNEAGVETSTTKLSKPSLDSADSKTTSASYIARKRNKAAFNGHLSIQFRSNWFVDYKFNFFFVTRHWKNEVLQQSQIQKSLSTS